MISSKELRQKDLEITQNGYNIAEVDALMAESAATIDAYESKAVISIISLRCLQAR